MKKHLYKGKKYPFLKAPLHSTPDGKLFIEQDELFNSVAFHKILDKAAKIRPLLGLK